MKHPFQNLGSERRGLFLVLLVLTLLVMGAMNVLGSPLINSAAPFGIISFELAGSSQRAAEILASWDHDAQLYAALNLGLDFLFMVLYSTTIGLGCIWASDVLAVNNWPLEKIGLPLAWGQWLAALLDALENIALIVILLSTGLSPWSELARIFAIVKFGLVFLGMVYVFLGLVSHLTRRMIPVE